MKSTPAIFGELQLTTHLKPLTTKIRRLATSSGVLLVRKDQIYTSHFTSVNFFSPPETPHQKPVLLQLSISKRSTLADYCVAKLGNPKKLIKTLVNALTRSPFSRVAQLISVRGHDFYVITTPKMSKR